MIKFNHFQAVMMVLLPLIAMVTYQSINLCESCRTHTSVLKSCRKVDAFEINLF